MKQIPNKVFVLLLAIALVISAASMVVNLNKLGSLAGNGNLFTASAVSSSVGTSNLSITSSTSITNNVATINFGAGTVNASCPVCSMGTERGKNSVCCVSFTNITTGGFLLENTGNVNISVGFVCTGSCSAANFIGAATSNAFLLFTVDALNNGATGQGAQTGAVDTVKSCVGGTQGDNPLAFDGWTARTNQSGTPGNNGTISVASTGGWLCGNATVYPLQADNTQDAGVVHLNITIDDAEVGTGIQKNVTFTFNATSSG